MVTNKDTLEKKGFLKGLGGRIKYLFNPASFDKAVNDGAEKTINKFIKEVTPFEITKESINKGLMMGNLGSNSANRVRYENWSSREGFGQKGLVLVIPRSEMDYYYWFGFNHPVLMSIIKALSGETFRNGLSTRPNFESKCEECGTTYDHAVEQCNTDDCTSKEITLPKAYFREKIEDEIIDDEEGENYCNENYQTVLDVVKELVIDLDILDTLFGVIAYTYDKIGTKLKLVTGDDGSLILDKQGNPQPDRTYKSFRRYHPARMAPYIDETGKIGGAYTCVFHRTKLIDENGTCEECGSQLMEITHGLYANTGEDVSRYYIRGEVIQASQVYPSLIAGNPPVAILFDHLQLLSKQLGTMVSYYFLERTANGIIFVKHNNAKELEEMWDSQQEKRFQNPHYLPVMQVDPNSQGAPMGFIPLDNTPKEMEYIPVREESTRLVSSFYGVSLMFLNDASMGGGLNNEGLQITVTNRAVAVRQEFIFKKIFVPLMKAMEIEDYSLILNPSEEQDEKAEVDLQKLKNEVAEGWQRLGYDFERGDDGEWVLGEKREVEEVTDPFMDALGEDEAGNGQSAEERVKPMTGAPAKPDHEVSI